MLLLASILLLAVGCSKKKNDNNYNNNSLNPSSSIVSVSNPPKPDTKKPTDKPTQFVPNIAAEEGAGNKVVNTKLKSKEVNNGLPALPECASNFDCYQIYYQDVTKKFGVTSAFAQLKKQYSQNNYVQAQCHPLTHVIGQSAVDLYSTLSEAYTKGDSFCWSGYYHGLMEGMVFKLGKTNFPKMLNEICSDLPGKAVYSFDYFNCVHGLGHGVMVFTNTELFDSLKLCDTFNGQWEKTSCYGGVFMENVIVDNKNHFTKYLKKDDLLYPCNAVETPYKEQCYLMQTSYILKQNNGDFRNTFALCSKADDDFRDTCFQSLGRDASSRSNYVIGNIKNICSLGTDFDQQSNCVIGAVKDVTSYYHSGKQATELCSSLDASLQDICSSTATSYYKSF